jgi:hypothetical protein
MPDNPGLRRRGFWSSESLTSLPEDHDDFMITQGRRQDFGELVSCNETVDRFRMRWILAKVLRDTTKILFHVKMPLLDFSSTGSVIS